jgi:hypothetical protein
MSTGSETGGLCHSRPPAPAPLTEQVDPAEVGDADRLETLEAPPPCLVDESLVPV